ncbi:hypothetical protein D3C85_1168230 [compost metagenome]
MKHLHHHRTGDDRQRRNVGTEPQREQIPGLAMAFGKRYEIDRMVLDQLVLL